MTRRRMRLSLAFASAALVFIAAAFSTSDRWNFDFAQYKGVPRPQAQDEFRFVIVGDRTGGAQWGIMPQVFREINLLDPDFVISVGDIIDGGGDEDTVNGIWDEFDKTELSVLKVPFVYMPGNHDIYSPGSKKVYEKRYGPRFKSFNYRGLHFICLNTQESAGNRSGDRNDDRFRGGGFRSLGDEQLEWLKDDIARNKDARRILIFMHQPTWDLLNPVYPMLEGLNVNVFAGHYHKYSYQERNGIPHIICSATAAYIPNEGDEAFGRFRSYLMATVRDDELKLALIKLGGVYEPKYIMEQDTNAVRALSDSCAIVRDGDGVNAPTQVICRNPMPYPISFQIVRSTRGSSTHLFDGNEPVVRQGETIKREVDWPKFAGAPVAQAEYRVVYHYDNSGGVRQSFDYPIEARVRRVTQAATLSAPPTIDGDVSDWAGAKWQPIGERSQAVVGLESWQGPHDLSAQFAVAQDEKNFYVAVKVSDDTIAFSSRTSDGDSVELFMADADDREISYSRETDDFRHLVVAPFSGGEEQGRGATSGETRLRKVQQRGIWGGPPSSNEFTEAKAAYSREANRYTIEVAFPRLALAWDDLADTVQQLDIAINDRDLGGGLDSKFIWSGNDRNGDSSRYHGRVELSNR